MKKVFISQPMRGLTDEEILEKISNRLWWIALWLALTYFGL